MTAAKTRREPQVAPPHRAGRTLQEELPSAEARAAQMGRQAGTRQRAAALRPAVRPRTRVGQRRLVAVQQRVALSSKRGEPRQQVALSSKLEAPRQQVAPLQQAALFNKQGEPRQRAALFSKQGEPLRQAGLRQRVAVATRRASTWRVRLSTTSTATSL